jgi:putative membrane protein
MIKTFQLAGYEVRRFKGPLPILGLLFLVLLPLLFGALYLWSSWDPFGKTDQIPVAVVNEDEPVQTASGSLIDAGTRVVAQLQDDEIYDWQFVDADTAAAGLANGDYYLTITIPPDFSANLASGGTEDPQRAVVNVRRDDANGYFISILTASVQDKLATAIDAAAIGAYFDSVFTNLETIQSEAQLAADAAAQLATTATDAATQATELNTGVITAKDSSAQLLAGITPALESSAALVTGLTAAQAGSAAIANALSDVETSAGNIAPGAESVAQSTQDLSNTVGPELAAIGGALPSISTGASDVSAAGAELTSIITAQLDPLIDQVNALDPTLYGELLVTRNALSDATNSVNTGAASINTAVTIIETNQSGDLSSVGPQLNEISTSATETATAAQGLESSLSNVSSQLSTVDAGFSDGIAAASDVNATLTELQTVATALDQGLTTDVATSDALLVNTTTVQTGAADLAAQLTESAERVPTLTPDQRSNAEQVLSSPADVLTTVDNAAIYYGRGLSPFMFALAIWVFCLAVFSLLRPITLRALAGRASSARIAVAGWLPIVGTAALGSLVLLAVAWFALGLDPVNVGGSTAVVLLAAACFTAIAHLLRTWLGLAGTAIAMVLLVLQVSCSGGIYPVETMPAPLRVISPAMPMTYLIDALRITFTGGPIDRLWLDIGILAGFTLAAVGICVFVVSRKRRFSPGMLHPALP